MVMDLVLVLVMMMMMLVMVMMMVIAIVSEVLFPTIFLGYDIFWGLLGRLFSIVSNELVLGKLKQLAGLGFKGVIGSIGISDP